MIARLEIETALRSGKTVLQNCFFTPPFKVLDVTEDKGDPALHLMLMNASPGVLDGDAYGIHINVAEGCSLRLHTQSYQRLFQMKSGASQCLKIRMEANSFFCFLPHPSVPHAGAHFTSGTSIFLNNHCTLLWGEVLTCGRKGSGEAFQFSMYHSVTEIFLNGRLVIKENLLLQPVLTDAAGIGQLEGFTHQASFIYLNEAAAMAGVMDSLHEWLLPETNICFGITALPANGFLIRMLGHKGEQLHGLLKKLAARLTGKKNTEQIEHTNMPVYAR